MDRALAGIRRAHFVVADFTGQSPNVSYEAAFVRGIGRELIECCRKDQAELERRNGYCPSCKSVLICNADGKLPAAQFDHWYARHRNEPEAIWMVCAACSRALEDPHFMASGRSAFCAYQRAVMVILAESQRELFDLG